MADGMSLGAPSGEVEGTKCNALLALISAPPVVLGLISDDALVQDRIQ